MKRVKNIAAIALLFSVLGSSLALAGCSSEDKKTDVTESTTVSETVAETTTETEETEETTVETTKKDTWTPADAGIYDKDALTERIEMAMFDPEGLQNETLKKVADKFTSDGLDLIKLNASDMDFTHSNNKVMVVEGFRATNSYVQYTESSGMEGIESLVMAYAVSFPDSVAALEFYDENTEKLMTEYPDTDRAKTETGMIFEYSDDTIDVWTEYIADGYVVVMYEEYFLFD